MHRRRKFLGATLPKRCDAMVFEEGNRIPVKCETRVFKAGMCAEHFAGWKKDKADKVANPSEPVQRCGEYKCFRTAVINFDGKPLCMKCFNKRQKKVVSEGNQVLITEDSNDAEI